MRKIIMILNRYVRRTGKIVNSLLVLNIFVWYGLEIGRIINIPIGFELAFFVALILNNMLFLLYAKALKYEFRSQVLVFHNRGIPLRSTEGFRYSKNAVYKSVSHSVTLNILIIMGTIFHFTLDIVSRYDHLHSRDWMVFVSYFGVSLVLIGLSLFLQIEYPDHSLLEPGNFISYHQPKSIPTFLDNILADSLKSFLDPRTRFQLDRWLSDIETKLDPEFEPELDIETRVDRAIERIILVLYLQKTVPALVTHEIVKAHLRKIIVVEHKKDFVRGTDSGLPLEVFSRLIDRMIEDVPEIFMLVDRLLVEIMVNSSMFTRTDKIVETVIPDDIDLDIKQAFRILVFVLNTTRRDNRVVEVAAESSRHIEPPSTSIKFELEAGEERIIRLLKDHRRINGEMVYSERIIEILSNMLQIGDATWLQFIPQEYGKHVLNLSVKENGFQTYGTSIPIHVQFSFKKTFQRIMSSLSGIGGAIYPLFKALLLYPVF